MQYDGCDVSAITPLYIRPSEAEIRDSESPLVIATLD